MKIPAIKNKKLFNARLKAIRAAGGTINLITYPSQTDGLTEFEVQISFKASDTFTLTHTALSTDFATAFALAFDRTGLAVQA
ncbi:MAG: hypothetical protein ABFD92_02075 [Planctomycetaceae bacterium]|nr:hypothetical protein [Planctomycetaceae bacterium]